MSDAGFILREIRFASESLGRESVYTLVTPDGDAPEAGWPVVMLLHGLGRDHRTVTGYQDFPRWYANRPFALVCPNGEAGWYYDRADGQGGRYQSLLLEVLDHAHGAAPLAGSRERTGVMGWSMGGYGAMRLAEWFPERFSAVATVIGLLDFPSKTLPDGMPMGVPPVFGIDQAAWREANPRTHAARLRDTAVWIRAAQGAWDFPMNQAFHETLVSLGIAHQYAECDGEHIWSAVAEALPRMFDFFEAQWRISC